MIQIRDELVKYLAEHIPLKQGLRRCKVFEHGIVTDSQSIFH